MYVYLHDSMFPSAEPPLPICIRDVGPKYFYIILTSISKETYWYLLLKYCVNYMHSRDHYFQFSEFTIPYIFLHYSTNPYLHT